MGKSRVYLARIDDSYQSAGREELSKAIYQATGTALDALGFKVRNKSVYIKVNLTKGLPSAKGLTIDIGAVIAVLERLHDCPRITIGDSCSTTEKAFDELGYNDLLKKYPNLRLDFIPKGDVVWKDIPVPYHTKKMPFHGPVFSHDYLINIAKMKIHSLAGVTLCLKNNFGFIPTREYRLLYHPFIRKAMLDFNQILHSDFCIVEGAWGNECDEVISNPKFSGAITAGKNILAVDTVAAAIMGVNVDDINTYTLAYSLWGRPEIELLGNTLDEVKTKYNRTRPFKTKIRYIKETIASMVFRLRNRYKHL